MNDSPWLPEIVSLPKLTLTLACLLIVGSAYGPEPVVYAQDKLSANPVSAELSVTTDQAPIDAQDHKTQRPANSKLSTSPTQQTELTTGEVQPQGVPNELFAFPAEHHLWASFPIGAWREIEITTETFDDKGELFGRSVTVQKESLKAVAEDSYVLEIQATVEVAGKQIVGPVNTRILRFLTDRTGPVFSTIRHKDETISLESSSVVCQVWDVLYGEEAQNLRDRLYYSANKFPHVLRRETYERVENVPIESSPADVSHVLAESVPMLFEGKVFSCVCEKSTRLRNKGTIQTIRMVSSQVPGGEIQSWSTDFNAEARPSRWSVLNLIDYGVNSPPGEAVEKD